MESNRRERERERAIRLFSKLGPLEQMVLEQVAQGAPYEELAKRERLSLATVAVVCDSAAENLGVSFPQALQIARLAQGHADEEPS